MKSLAMLMHGKWEPHDIKRWHVDDIRGLGIDVIPVCMDDEVPDYDRLWILDGLTSHTIPFIRREIPYDIFIISQLPMYQYWGRKAYLAMQTLALKCYLPRAGYIFYTADDALITAGVPDIGSHVRIHSLDYDVYLDMDRESVKYKDPYVLFIDQNAVNDTEFNLCREKSVCVEYYDSMCRFFDRVESHGVNIKIAGHPRNPDVNPYGGREVIFGDTANLIKDSQGIITHYSTAVSFAALFNKPITFVATPEMLKDHPIIMDYINSMATYFREPVLNTDDGWYKTERLFKYDYNEYIRKYICPDNIPDVKNYVILKKYLELAGMI